MRNKSLFVLVLALTAAMFTSCEFFKEFIPQKVTIKADPTISASLGSTTIEMNEFLSAETISDMVSSGDSTEGLEVYSYKPADLILAGDNTLRYLVKYPLASMSFDVTSQLDGVDLDSQLTNSISEQKFSIPAVAYGPLSEVVTIPQISLPEIGSNYQYIQVPETSYFQTYDIEVPNDIVLGDFEYVTVDNAVIILGINCYNVQATSGYSLTINSVTLTDTDGTIIGTGTGYEGSFDVIATTDGGQVSIPVSGKQLPSTMKVKINVTSGIGTYGNTNEIFVSTYLWDKDSPGDAPVVVGGKGFTVAGQSVSLPSSTIDIGAGSSFVDASVAEGSLGIQLSLPEGMSGISTDVTLYINQTDGLSISDTYTPDENGYLTVDLVGKIINGNPITVSGSVNVSIKPEDEFALNQTTNDAAVSTSVGITRFASVTLNTSEINKSFDVTQVVPDELKNMVSSLTLSKVGLNLTVQNSMPSGNDITLTVNSTAFGLSSAQTVFTGGADAPVTQSVTNDSGVTLDLSTLSAFDMSLQLSVGTGDTLTLLDVVPGTQLISAGANLIFEWSAVTIAPAAGAAGLSGTFPLDLSALGEFLGSTLSLKDLPVYLYMSSADLKDKASLTGYISASYTDAANGATTVNLLNSAATPGNMPFVVGPALTYEAETDDVVISNDADLRAAASGTVSGFADVFNAAPADLELAYNMSLSALTLTKEEFDAMGTIDLNADMYIVLPFDLAVNAAEGEAAVIDLTALTGSDTEGTEPEDLLGRTEASGSDDDLAQLLDGITSLTIGVKYTNSTGISGLSVEMSHVSGDASLTKTLSLNDGADVEATIEITGEDLDYVLNTYPFNPSFEIVLPPEADLKLTNGASLVLAAKVTAVTDLEYTKEFPWCDNSTSIEEVQE